MRRLLLRCRGLVVGFALTVGCGAEGSTKDEEQQSSDQIEIFSWWLAPGEVGALNGVIALFEKEHPGVHVVNAVLADAENSRETLATRMAEGMPPDLYQENARALPAFVANNPDKLLPLDDFYAEHGLGDVILPELIESVSVNGKAYGLPMGVHRSNSLFYNKAIFAAHGLTPPSSTAELLEICKTLKAKGVTPIATSHQGWVQVLLFEVIHEGVLGTERYKAFLDGDPGSDNAKLSEAAEVYGEIVENYVNDDAGDEAFGWAEAANLLYEGEAAMFIHGDWAKGLYTDLGFTPNIDFGVMGAPGATDLFVYELDTWVMPKGSPNPEGARGFLKTAISTEGQLAFDRVKGATSARADFRTAGLDSIGAQVLEELVNASVRVMSELPDFSAVHEAFVADGDRQAFVEKRLELYEAYRTALKP
jgi:glucose/mannose transport system substrate-binding protein